MGMCWSAPLQRSKPPTLQPFSGIYQAGLRRLQGHFRAATAACIGTQQRCGVLQRRRSNAVENSRPIRAGAADGNVLVNGGAVPIQGPRATVANTSLIELFGLAGNDTLALDEANGALPHALLFGGAGNDTLIGGSGDDRLFGEAGDDRFFG